MEKKLLVLITVMVCATSLDAARTVTVPRGGTSATKKTPAQKVKPIKETKYEMSMDEIANIHDDLIATVGARIEKMEQMGLPLSSSDYHNLISNLKALTYPTPKMAGGELMNDNAKYLYAKIKDAFYKIKQHPDLMPGEGFGMAVSMVHEAMGHISSFYTTTTEGTSSIGAKGSKTAATVGAKTYK